MLPLRQARLPRSPVPFQINAGLSICKSRRRLLYPRSSTLSFLFFSQIYSFTSLNCSPPPSAVRLSSIALLSSCSIIITQLRPTHLWYFRQPTPGSIFRIYLLWRWGMRNVCVCVWSWPRSNKAIPYLLYMYQHRFFAIIFLWYWPCELAYDDVDLDFDSNDIRVPGFRGATRQNLAPASCFGQSFKDPNFLLCYGVMFGQYALFKTFAGMSATIWSSRERLDLWLPYLKQEHLRRALSLRELPRSDTSVHRFADRLTSFPDSRDLPVISIWRFTNINARPPASSEPKVGFSADHVLQPTKIPQSNDASTDKRPYDSSEIGLKKNPTCGALLLYLSPYT